MFNEEAEQSLDEFIEEATEARREEAIIFYEGCTIVTAPTGPPPEYLTVEVDTINDYNVMWRGVPTMPAVGDEVIVWENPLSHRREIWGGSGTTGVSGGGFWCQKVIVAKCGGDFTLLSAAITWINALAAGPLITRLFAINILGGNFAEINNVTIPPFVHVSGEGEGTEIEMGAFTLIMAANSSLQDVVVESSDPVDAVRVNGVANVVLRNVSVIETSTGDCFHILGVASGVYLYNCIANVPAAAVGFHIEESAVAELYDCLVITTGAYNAATYGFELENSCAVIMSGCRAENDIFLADGLHMGTSTGLFCITRYCIFSAKDDDVLTQTNNLWYHQFCEFDSDNSTIAAGSHTALPTKRFNQTLIVAEAGGDFQALSEAIAWINAQGDAAAGKLYGVLMLMGNFAEGAPVTIPQYVSVVGKGEGTEIEMGANTLSLAADSSLENLVVESSHNTTAVQVNGVTNVFLRNVRIIQTGGVGGCLYVIGANSEVACRDVILEATSTAMFGFYAQDNGTVLSLEYCTADDPTNFTRALWIANYTVTVTARYCTFHGSTDDITLSTNATLNHFMCQFDPDNCTWQGTEVPMVTGRANFDDVVTFEDGITFDNVASNANIITIPTAQAIALKLIDTNAIEYLRIDTAPQLVVHFNQGEADVDHIFSASGITNALYVQGSSGSVGIGTVPDAGYELHFRSQGAANVDAKFESGGGTELRLHVVNGAEAQINSDNHLCLQAVTGGVTIGATTLPDSLLELERIETLAGNVGDGFAAALTFDPGYTGAFTVSRHNYMWFQDVSVAGGAAVTVATLGYFNAAIGTHKCLPAAFQTTDSGADTTNWAGGLLINILGVLYKIPYIAA